jgi:hypothetical protein
MMPQTFTTKTQSHEDIVPSTETPVKTGVQIFYNKDRREDLRVIA